MQPKSNSGPNKVDRIQEIIRLEGEADKIEYDAEVLI